MGGTNKKKNESVFYVFCSGFARDVIYNLMLFKQRSVLHKQICEILGKYQQLLLAANVADIAELENALKRHRKLAAIDGMKSSAELEMEQKQNNNLQLAMEED